MTSFRGILGQSWTLKFHKVKLLKFQNFNFYLKLLWNWSFFHYEKIMRFKDWPQVSGAGRGRAGHHHGSHTPTSPEAVLLHSSLLGYIKLWDTLYGQNEKGNKRKMAKNLTLVHWDSTQDFEQNFPAQDFNFEGDYINRAQGS